MSRGRATSLGIYLSDPSRRGKIRRRSPKMVQIRVQFHHKFHSRGGELGDRHAGNRRRKRPRPVRLRHRGNVGDPHAFLIDAQGWPHIERRPQVGPERDTPIGAHIPGCWKCDFTTRGKVIERIRSRRGFPVFPPRRLCLCALDETHHSQENPEPSFHWPIFLSI